MFYGYVNKELLSETVKQVFADSELSKKQLIIVGGMIMLIELMKLSNDDLMDKMQELINNNGVDYDLAKNHFPEGNENDLYRYSQEALDAMHANDLEEIEILCPGIYG